MIGATLDPCPCGSLLPGPRCCGLGLAELRQDSADAGPPLAAALDQARRQGGDAAVERLCLAVPERSPGQPDALLQAQQGAVASLDIKGMWQ